MSDGTNPERERAAPAERLGWCLVLALSALTVGATLVQTPGVKSDPGWGILAAHQYSLGKSPNLQTLTTADPANLLQDRGKWISWWAPAYQTVPFAFRVLGLKWGDAIKTTVLLAWLIGAVAWAIYFRAAAGRRAWLPWLLAAFLCFRYSHDQAYLYNGGDRLLLSSFPVMLLLNLWVALTQRPGAVWLAGAVGAGSAVLFLVKYSAALSVVGFGVAWFWGALRHRLPWPRAFAWAFGAGAVLLFIRWCGFPGGATAASLSRFDGDVVPSLWWSLFSWPLAISDLESLISWVFLRPGGASIGAEAMPWFGFGLCCLLLLVGGLHGLSRPQPDASDVQSLCLLFATANFLAVCVLLFLIDTFGGHYLRYHAWYFQIAAVPLLPWLFSALYDAARDKTWPVRIAGAAALVLLFVVPAFYGAAVLADKAFRRATHTRALVSAERIRLDLLGNGANAEAAYREIERQVGGKGAVLYVTSPDLAFRLAHERLLVIHADFETVDQLKGRSYEGYPPGGVALFLPRLFQANGKRSVIQQSFRDVAQWRCVDLHDAPEWLLWVSQPPDTPPAN